MTSNYLWKFYLENDAVAFQRLLLEGVLPCTHRGSEAPGPSGGSVQKRTSHDDVETTDPQAAPLKQKSIVGQILKGQKDIRLSFNAKTLREYDAQGRTLLHLAATEPQGLPFLRALLSHSQIDLIHPDLESGWTALHRALYHGNIGAARLLLDAEATKIASGGFPGRASLVKSKDHCGETPFDLLYETIAGREAALGESWMSGQDGTIESDDVGAEDSDEDNHPRVAAKSLLEGGAGDEVLAFGSNQNLTLGFGDEDDRQFPEKVPLQRPNKILADLCGKGSYQDLTVAEAFRPLSVRDIQLSKLHSAILTTDPYNNLYICGFGHGGRLGLGGEQLTQFTYKNVSIGDMLYTVSKVALGLDHTVVVLCNGEVWTWGLNQHGQLGYATTGGMRNKTGQGCSPIEEAELIQSTPRRVIDVIKKEKIIGCAASRIHTVLYSHDTLYVFGRNDGQLGILDLFDNSTPPFVPRKVVAGCVAFSVIHMVAATDKSTVVMLKTLDVWVFANHGYTRVMFPILHHSVRMPISPSRVARRGPKANLLTKITTGGETLCGLTCLGDVYVVNLEDLFWSSGNKNALKKLTPPIAQCVWSHKTHFMAAKDIDVGQDGIIICTESGSVWRRMKRMRVNEMHNTVSASTGIFSGSPQLGIDGKAKDYKFSRIAGLTRITLVRSNKFGAYAAIRKDCTIMKTQIQAWIPVKHNLLPTFPAHLQGLHPILDTKTWVNFGNGFPDPSNLKRWKKLISSMGTETCDMTIYATLSDIKTPVHKAIILARCFVLPKILEDFVRNGISKWSTKLIRLTANGGNLQLDIQEDICVVMLLIMEIYAVKHNFLTNRNLRNRVTVIGHALQIFGSSHVPKASCEIGSEVDLSEALENPLYTAHGDMIVQLADGEQMRAYSTLLRLKSPFFETLFKGNANGGWISSRIQQMKASGETAVKVDMTHIRRQVFQMVLCHIYSGKVDLLQNLKVVEDVNEYLEFVLDVLAFSDELMLKELSTICQQVIGSYVNTRNASRLLNAVASYSQNRFKNMCLQYICFNLETMLENHLIDDLDDWIMEEVEQSIRKIQRQSSIHSGSPGQETRLLKQYPDMLEASARERRALIASYSKAIEAIQVAEPARLISHQSANPLVASTTPKKQRKKPTVERPATALITSNSPIPREGPLDETDPLPQDVQMKQQDPVQGTSGVGLLTHLSINSTPRVDLAAYTDNGGPSSVNSNVLGPPSFSAGIIPISIPETPANPWRDASTKVQKLGLKEIMAQAAVVSHQESNISLGQSSLAGTVGKAPPPGTTFTPSLKLSQKEKRKQHQKQQNLQQDLQQNQILPAAPEKGKPAPWVIPVQVPRVALRDILADGNQPPVVTTTRCSNHTCSSAQKRPSQSSYPPPTPPRTIINSTDSSTPPRLGPAGPPTPILSQISNASSPNANISTNPLERSPPLTTMPSLFSPPTQKKPPRIDISSIQAFPSLPHPVSSSDSCLEPMIHLSLADIIEQQEAEQDILKGKVEKRKFEDIQAEQKFLDWWEKESERVRLEVPGVTGKGTRGRRNGGRGGRGRGGKAGRPEAGGRGDNSEEKKSESDCANRSGYHGRCRGRKSRGNGERPVQKI